MSLESGLVFASDSRTHAGVDHVATFRKMTVYEKAGDRVIVLLSSGNLSITQSVLDILGKDRPKLKNSDSLWKTPSMIEAARTTGRAIRQVYDLDGGPLKRHGEDFNVSFILGGQIKGERPRLFNIYSAGNFIEATRETCYFQIGEIKYGKPILDRIIQPECSLNEGAKCALISFDSTIRSNISVGLPIDLLVYERDSLKIRGYLQIDRNDLYFNELKGRWSEGLKELFYSLKDPEWPG
jgi:putative proteasome-type protease